KDISFIEENYVKTKFEKYKVNGIFFPWLTEEKLTPGPFKFLYEPAKEIMLLVEKLKDLSE
ncbi:5862_t:CDS:1, partial [Rhizophagus irregularis]